MSERGGPRFMMSRHLPSVGLRTRQPRWILYSVWARSMSAMGRLLPSFGLPVQKYFSPMMWMSPRRPLRILPSLNSTSQPSVFSQKYRKHEGDGPPQSYEKKHRPPSGRTNDGSLIVLPKV